MSEIVPQPDGKKDAAKLTDNADASKHALDKLSRILRYGNLSYWFPQIGRKELASPSAVPAQPETRVTEPPPMPQQESLLDAPTNTVEKPSVPERVLRFIGGIFR